MPGRRRHALQAATVITALMTAVLGTPAAVARSNICKTYTMNLATQDNDCKDLCQTIMRAGQTRQWRVGFWKLKGPVSGDPRDVGKMPMDITSCQATLASGCNGIGCGVPCTVTMCGPVWPTLRPDVHAPSVAGRDIPNLRPKPKPRIGPPAPGPMEQGLLEGSTGLPPPNAPSPIGMPLGGAKSGGSPNVR